MKMVSSYVWVNVHLELFVCSIRSSSFELAAVQFKDKGFHLLIISHVVVLFFMVKWYFEAENGMLLGHDLEVILSSDDFKSVLCVLEDDAFGTDAPHTPAPDDLDASAMKIGTGEHRTSARGSYVDSLPIAVYS